MNHYIGPEGPLTAKLAVVAEKPSHDEILKNRPLIGQTGQMLRRMLLKVGVDPAEVYLTNAVKSFDTVGNPSDLDLRREQTILYKELSALPNLNCIVALGNSALVSLSNFVYNDIGHRRGSKINSFIRKKMIPTFHPSYIVKGNWEMAPVVEFDLARAKKESEFPEIRRPERYYNVLPTFTEALDWLHHLEKGEWLSFDIETRKSGEHMNWYMTTIAFAADPKEGFCIPFARQDRSSYWSPEQECVLWKRIQKLLALEYKRYVTQNGLFDCWQLYRHGVVCPYMANGFDTMYAHRYLAADLPHALDFLVSIYTDEEYYKDESGKHTSEVRVSDEQFQVYNAKDAAITLEVAFAEIDDMVELGMYDYYMKHKQSQFDVLLDMRARGFHVDKQKKASLIDRFNGTISTNTEIIRSKLGWVPNTKSPIEMSKVFDKFGIRPARTPLSGQPKIDEEHLLSYAHKWPESQEVLSATVAITQQRTLLGSFTRLTTDARGFYHASYDLSKAKTGRLASEGADEGHLLGPKKKAGPQMQNQPRMMRAMYIPDNPELDEITTFDLSQAEPHVVAWASQDIFWINAFLAKQKNPKIDAHRIAALQIFKNYDTTLGLPSDELMATVEKVCAACLAANEPDCSHSQRYLAKRCKNGFAYKMGWNRLMSVLRGDNIFILAETAKLIERRVVTSSLREWWDEIAFNLRRTHWLTAPYGNKREFFGQLNDITLGEALSWYAQSTVTHITCHAMRYIHHRFVRERLPARVLTQTHDSNTINNRKADHDYVLEIIKDACLLPVMIHGRELNIPHEVMSGPTWR